MLLTTRGIIAADIQGPILSSRDKHGWKILLLLTACRELASVPAAMQSWYNECTILFLLLYLYTCWQKLIKLEKKA